MKDPVLMQQILTIDRLNKLESIYNQVPKGTCNACARCCSESVNISYLEFMNIVKNGLPSLDEVTTENLKARLLSYYLLEWVKPQQCPFLDGQKNCLIYAVRPLPCRIFGTSNRVSYKKNYQEIAAQNRQVAKAIKIETGYLPSSRVVNKEIPFCESFVPEQELRAEEIDALYGALIHLDGQLYFEGLMDDSKINGDLVGWMIDWMLANLSEERSGHKRQLITKQWLYTLKKECLIAYHMQKSEGR